MSGGAGIEDVVASPVSPHTVSQRFLITLGAQVSKSALSFLTGLIVARDLGPNEYGNLAFLIGSFAGLRLILDMASSQAFFTLAALRPRSKTFYVYYSIWLTVGEIVIPFLFLALLLPRHVVDVLWQSQARDRVLLAFFASTFQTLLWPQVIQLGEVVRRTRTSQSLTIAIYAAQFLAVIALYLLHWLTVSVFLATTSLTFIAGCILAFIHLPRPWHSDVPPESLSSVFGEFVVFCRPLIVSMSFWAATGWIEVWLIQHFVGSVTQGYYALGTQISQIGVLATTALQNIFWREVAEMERTGDDSRVRAAYVKTTRALLLTAAVPVAFLIPWAPEIVQLALGSQYREAAPAVAVLFLYPISQTIFTPAVAMFSVMRQTRALAMLSGSVAVIYVATSYLLLAPGSAFIPGIGIGTFGYGLSALALGVKLSMTGYGQAAAWEYVINRKRSWRSEWPHRIAVFAILAGLSGLARFVGAAAMVSLPPIVAMFIAGLVFATLVGAVMFRWPELLGVPEYARNMFHDRIRGWLGALR